MSEVISNDALLVLGHFGLEERDFPELDRIVDFEAVAKSIRKPTRTAVCNIIDSDGKVVMSDGAAVKVGVEVEVKNNKDVLKELTKKSMRFLKWF